MKRRYFWPIDHPEPKIEYIDFIFFDRDVTRGAESTFAESFLGRENPEGIFLKPYDVASDGMGRVFVTDIGQREVWVLDFRKRSLHTLQSSEGVPPVQNPFAIAVGEKGELYVADPSKAEVYIFSARERLVKVFGREHLVRPVGIDVDDVRGRIYVADAGKHQVAVFDLNGQYLHSLGEPGGGPGEFNTPLDVAVSRGGDLFVLDTLNARVQVFSAQGEYLRMFGERGTALGSFSLPKGIAVDGSGHVYISDSRSHRFVIFDQFGNYLLTVGGRAVFSGREISPGGMNLPAGIDVDGKDAIWVVDGLNGMVHRFQFLNEEYLSRNPILPGQSVGPLDGVSR